MAINLSVYSNGNTSSKTITVDFVADFLASSANGVSDQTRYFFKYSTSARDSDNVAFGAKVAEGLDDLVLNSEKQRITDTAAAYTDIKSMIVDYTYDFIQGHAAELYSTSVTLQKPMKFN